MVLQGPLFVQKIPFNVTAMSKYRVLIGRIKEKT